MQILPIDQSMYGYKELYLRGKCAKLTKKDVQSEEFRAFVKELFNALYNCGNGVGLAAPQVGRMVSAAVIDLRDEESEPLLLINPSYKPLDDETVESTEGCLSFPGITCVVTRHKAVRVTAKDIDFNDLVFEADGFFAIVCQHEIDHLHGTVFIDKANKIISHDAYNAQQAQEALDFLTGEGESEEE